MLVEDPRDTLKALCALSDVSISWQSFKEKYEEIKRANRPISSQHTDTHFYSLSVYGIIKPAECGGISEYLISPVGKSLCQSLSEGRLNDYRKILSSILLNNTKKGPIFRAFMKFVKEKKQVTNEDILKFIGDSPITKGSKSIGLIARTLVAWCEEAGLIEVDKERKIVWYISQEPKKELTLEQFSGMLLEKYKQLRKTEIFGLQNIYVDILELRTLICAELAVSIEEFDDLLNQVLDSELGEIIRLYGAPTSFFANKENFSYNGRVYAYIMIKV